MAVETVVLPRTTKTDYESELLSVDFLRRLEDDEEITVIEDILISPVGLGETSRAIDSVRPSRVQFRMSGGVLGVVYTVRIRVTTSNSNQLEGCVEIEITDC